MKFLFFFLITLNLNAHAGPKLWRQYHLSVLPRESLHDQRGVDSRHTVCTGTLLKIENTCHLFTNAHCFKEDSDYVLAQGSSDPVFPEYQYANADSKKYRSSYGFFHTGPRFIQALMLKKRFSSMDLAEIKLSEEMQKTHCSELEPVNLKALDQTEKIPRSYAAIGFFMNLETVSFLGDKAWDRSQFKDVPKRIRSSLNVEHFYQLSGLTTHRGMSGGLVIDDKERPIGLVTRHIPYQEETFAIGLQDLVSFALMEKEPLPLNPEIPPLESNDQENGGGNEHANTEGPLKAKRSSLQIFRAPPEGILNPFRQEEILLNRCGIQMDGYEDYIATKNCFEQPVSRKKDEALPETLNTSLTERLLGPFAGKALSGKGTKIFYFKQSNHLDGWRKFAKGATTLEASGSKNHLYFKFKSRDLFRLMDKFSPPPSESLFSLYFFTNAGVPEVYLQYAKETPSARGTLYTVTDVKLVCETRNYLKLICWDKNEEFEFSLSAPKLGADSLKYRLAHRTGLSINPSEPQYEVMIYYYGELKVDEKKRLSDLQLSGQVLPGL